MAFVNGTETLTLKGTYQNPDGSPASGYIEIQLTQPVSDLNTKVSYTQKSMHYDLDAQGKVSVEIIKTGSTASDPVSLSRNVTVQITEVIEGANQYVWRTVIDTSALSEPGVFYLAEAAETVSRPANQYVSLGAFATGQNTKMDKAGGTFTGPVTFNDVLFVGTPTFNSHPTPKSYVDSADNLRAPLASPSLTGTPTAPTAAANTSSTQIATTAFATTADNLRAPLASPALTGTPTAPTAAATTSTTQIATTAFATTADNLRAPLASPTFTGTVTTPNLVISTGTAPASATSTGTKGQIAYASGFLYVCVATNTWQRVAIATF